MSDTPRTDEATYWDYASSGHSVDADFARKLERELNEAKKSPWKPLSEMPEALKDGRWLMMRWEYDGRKWCRAILWDVKHQVWADDPENGHIGFNNLSIEYMEIPK